MIFYFSGSGNSKYIAQRISDKTGCEVFHVSQHTPFSIPDNNEPIGFVFPVYFWGIPTAAIRFLSSLKINGQHYTYLVLDCGASTGDASGIVKKALGQDLDAEYSVLMPDTYVPLFDCSDDAKNQSILKRSEQEITNIIGQIEARAHGRFDKHRGLGRFYTTTMFPLYRRKTTKHFHATSDCIGCGKCAEVCPDRFITLTDNHPIWKQGHCNLCFACLHHCPSHAITYGKKSLSHGQYLCPGTDK